MKKYIYDEDIVPLCWLVAWRGRHEGFECTGLLQQTYEEALQTNQHGQVTWTSIIFT